MRAAVTIQMRKAAIVIHIRLISDPNRYIGDRAFSHCHGVDFADAKMLIGPPECPADPRLCLFDAQTEGADAIFAKERVRRTRVDHEAGLLVIKGCSNEKMIAETPLQRRAPEPFAREKRPQRSLPGIRGLFGCGRPARQE